MHQHVFNWRRSKPCLAGVMESRRRLHWLSGFGGPGGKSRIRSTCPDILLYANIRWSWVRWREKAERQKEGKKNTTHTGKGEGSKGEKEGKQRRSQRDEMMGMSCWCLGEPSRRHQLLDKSHHFHDDTRLGTNISKKKLYFLSLSCLSSINVLFTAKPKAKLLSCVRCIANNVNF